VGGHLLFAALAASFLGAAAAWGGAGWPLGLLAGAGAGFTIASPLLWTLSRLNSGLAAQPPEPVSARGAWSLSELIERVNGLIIQQRAVDSIRESLVHQTSESAAQQERNRMARDLHDSIKQQLYTINLSAAAAQAHWDTDSAKAKEALNDARRSVQEAMQEMNAMLSQLSPAPLEKVGLVQALKDQCEALGYRTGAEVQAEFGELLADDRWPIGAQESLFRIAQEALSNVARHARAKKVWVWLGLEGESLKLEVRDDGQGFDLGSPKSLTSAQVGDVGVVGSSGMGLNNIQLRARALQGTVKVMSAPAQGTTLTVNLPLVEPTVKEEVVKADHTLNKVLLSGAGGGLLLIAALYYPLRVLVPASFVAGWGEGSAALGLVAQVMAVVIWIGVGYGAARKAKASTRLDALVLGALAGLAAGVTVYLGLGAAAAGVVGTSAILQHGLTPALGDSAMTGLVVESVRGAMWWEYGTLWATLIVGAGLGSVGGSLSPLGPRESEHAWWYMPGSVVLVATVLVYGLTSIVSLAVFSSLDNAVFNTLTENAITLSPGLPVAGGLLLSVLTPLAFYYLALVGLYGVLQMHIQQKDLTSTLNKILLVNSIASSFLVGLLTLGMAIFILSLWSADLSPNMKAVAIVNALLNLVSAIPFLRLGFTANQRWRAVNNDTSGWGRDLLSILILVGVCEVFWALINALGSATTVNVIVLVVSVIVEAGLLFWLSRLPRRSTPALTRAMISPVLVPSGVSTLLGTTMVLVASLTTVVPVALALVFITIPSIPVLAGTVSPESLNFTVTSLVQTYFNTQLNTLLVALAFSLGGSAIGTLAIWAIGVGFSKR
jgi:signal transduction histidine kinase